MNVIVFASRKGGSGKSTLTAHLAAHASRPNRPCLMIDADPQGSLTMWHTLRGSGEPALRSGLRGISDIVKAAKGDYEWVFVDTPPTVSAVVADAIRAATLVVIPARPSLFDLGAVRETIEVARSARKPYAVVINGAPARRDEVEAPMVTNARESLGQATRSAVGGADHQPHALFDRARRGRGSARIRRGIRGGAGDGAAVVGDREIGEGDPRRLRWRHHAQAGGLRPSELILRERDWPPAMTGGLFSGAARYFLLGSSAGLT